MKKKNPSKWPSVYPQGTKEGDEEQAFFISLARNPEVALPLDGGYFQGNEFDQGKGGGIADEVLQEGQPVFQRNPANEDQWGYWELHAGYAPPGTTTPSPPRITTRVIKKAAKP